MSKNSKKPYEHKNTRYVLTCSLCKYHKCRLSCFTHPQYRCDGYYEKLHSLQRCESKEIKTCKDFEKFSSKFILEEIFE